MEREKNMIYLENYYMNVPIRMGIKMVNALHIERREVIYEGEFLDDLKKNKENDDKFKACFFNKVFNGLWYEYYYDGSIKYKGEYLSGKRNGFGSEYICNNMVFKGESLNGKEMEKEKNFIMVFWNLKVNI